MASACSSPREKRAMSFSAASALPSLSRTMRITSSRASKMSSKPSRTWTRFPSSARSKAIRLVTVAKRKSRNWPRISPSERRRGGGDAGAGDGDEAGEVVLDAQGEGRVLVEVRHHQVGVGPALGLEDDPRLG